MKNSLRMLFALLFLLCFATPSIALTYDGDVTPTVIYGAGNANGGWTIDSQNGVQVGLRTHVREPSPLNVFNSNGNGTYSYQSGTVNGMAYWNYDFSVNLNETGTGSNINFGDVTVKLGIDTDPGAGQTFTYLNPLTSFSDNAYGTDSTANGGGDDSATANADFGVNQGYYVMQNSENFAWTGLDATFGPATWGFVLSVTDNSTGALLAQTNMSVLIDGGAGLPPVPEPSTILLLGAGLIGLAGIGRKRFVAKG